MKNRIERRAIRKLMGAFVEAGIARFGPLRDERGALIGTGYEITPPEKEIILRLGGDHRKGLRQ